MSQHGSRAPRAALLAGLALASLLVVPYAAVHLDFARDVYVALRIARGESWPLLGPVLAGTFHLGPAWYYALALPLLAGGGWLAVVAFVGLVAALQFPLAYLAGKALHSRRAGLGWAVLLLLPSWSSFEPVFPLHTQWTAPALLAATLCAARFARRGRTKYAFGLGLAVALALHAHPSTLGLVPVAALALLAGARRGGGLARPLAAAVLAGALPFVPWLVDQAVRGFPLLEAAGAWAASEAAGGSLRQLPGFAWQALAGGAGYWVAVVMGAGHWAGAIAAVALALAGVVALAGWHAILNDPARRAPAVAVLLAAAVVGGVAVALRPLLPFYMTTPLHVALCGVLALGIAALRWPRGAPATLALAVFGIHAASVAVVAAAQVRGAWPGAVLPMFHVLAPADRPQPVALLPAYAMAPLGAWLCAGPVAVHGPLGARLVHDYALAARIACRAPDVLVGGIHADPRPRWIGLPRHLLRALELDPALRVASFGLLPVRAVAGAPEAWQPPAEPRYPPLAPAFESPVARTFRVPLPAGAHLAVTNLGAVLVPEPEVEVRGDATLWTPLAADAHTRVYGCAGCAATELEVRIRSRDPARVDVVVF